MGWPFLSSLLKYFQNLQNENRRIRKRCKKNIITLDKSRPVSIKSGPNEKNLRFLSFRTSRLGADLGKNHLMLLSL
jgi:hypothetical protein